MQNEKKDTTARKIAYKEGLKQFEHISDELVQAYRGYNSVCSASEMDGYILKINELRARRNLILGQLRQLEPTGKELLWKSYQPFS